MIQTLLFATDLCAYTPYVLQHVVSMANICGCQIVVVHAVDSLPKITSSLPDRFSPTQQQLLDSIRRRVTEAIVEEFLDMGGELVGVREVVVEAGEPAEVILKASEDYFADLIILGKHGVEGSSMGSVAHQVLDRAKVPVYTVPMLPNKQEQSRHPNLRAH